ncbi:MAG: hypothetical protein U0R50_13105 [Gaiellales bacterium]
MDYPARIVRLLGLVALVLAAAAALAPSPAAAKSKESCARKIVNDWYGDGKVDKIYPTHCYREAIRSLPVDVRDYSNAEEDILRALSYAKRGKPDPGPAGSRPGTDTTETSTTKGPTGHTGSTDDPDDTTDTSETVAAGDTDTAGPSSVPLPLIVLGGLAFLLLVAGGAGYVNRRMQTSAATDEGDEPDTE